MDAISHLVADIRHRLAPLLKGGSVALAVLFGSRPRGSSRPSSDIDLAILPDGDLAVPCEDILRCLKTDRVDVVDLRHAPPLLAMAVAQHGRPIYEKSPGTFAALASLALRRYNDTAKLRRLREKGLKNFLAKRGL